MSFHNLSISVLKVGRQMVGSLAIAAFFSGCIAEETPILPHQAGDVITTAVEMGTDYRWQLYFNLEKNQIVSRNLKTDWDLAFDANPNGNLVRLNSGKFMFGLNTKKQYFSEVTDTLGFAQNKRWDAANVPDSLVIGNSYNGKVYLLDLGYDEKSNALGFKKIKMVSVNREKYVLQYANIQDSTFQIVEIQKDTNYNYTYFSFKTNATVRVEPPKKDWDLAFTQYIHIFYEPYQPYLVTGVLLNTCQTYAAMDSTQFKFENMDYKQAISFPLTNKLDAIGYNWKSFGGFGNATGNYQVFSNYNYIIKDSKSILYKLRFIAFYDEQGRKGTPKFEFRRL
jgi:predicted transcriptional regulator with HTH domain